MHLNAEHTRLEKTRADAQVDKNAVERGEYAPIELLRFAAGDVASQIKSIVEGIPKRKRNSMPVWRAREIRILENELAKAMNAAAQIRVAFDNE